MSQSWKCHAKPAALDGATCGYVNDDGGQRKDDRVHCRGCGCTKKASDDRLASKVERQRQKTHHADGNGPRVVIRKVTP